MDLQTVDFLGLVLELLLLTKEKREMLIVIIMVFGVHFYFFVVSLGFVID